MNVKQAKEEICHTVQAYLSKDEFGEYRIPVIHQRPLLLIGPPGIGKTAIMEQAARECGINLVSYSITHHTRQSAIGLPFIEQKEYGGKMYSVTEYTISEIIASLYDKMEETGIREGILFLDEINCVSETLAPAMLQFLQAKTFGTHRVPDGWIIAAAGNPPEYNKSVREFDIVTLDRVKKIDVEENYQIWREYAVENGVHSAILSYLDLKPENFYAVQTSVDGKEFVTARGWEDLSRLMHVYEQLEIPIDETVIKEYLQHAYIAKDFAAYLDLYNRYEKEYDVGGILAGKFPEKVMKRAGEGGFDERLSLVGLLMDGLCKKFRAFYEQDRITTEVYRDLRECQSEMEEGETGFFVTGFLGGKVEERTKELETLKRAGLSDEKEIRLQKSVIEALSGILSELTDKKGSNEEIFEEVRELFAALPEERDARLKEAADSLEHAFDFMETAFGTGEEMVLFVTELAVRKESLQFIRENGCDRYYAYSEQLMFAENRSELAEDLRKFS